MCGILGELVYNQHRLLSKKQFLSLLDLSRSRGPDSQGYYSNSKNIQFGFNRLAILDLSDNANQPINSPSGSFTMVFNGEIYNHMDLRNGLPKNKYVFKGHGDTETLIVCFDHYGIVSTVEMLNGMFAIGIFDHRDSSLHLIRDFAGIKPLHYGWNDNMVVFASQFNQISRHPGFNNEPIDEEVLKLYLSQNFIPSPFGLLKKTYSVKPGEIITIDSEGRKHSQLYWTFPEYNHHPDEDIEVLEQVENELNSAVQAELSSDVPLGAFLSGGVDSPLICYHIQNNIGRTLLPFQWDRIVLFMMNRCKP